MTSNQSTDQGVILIFALEMYSPDTMGMCITSDNLMGSSPCPLSLGIQTSQGASHPCDQDILGYSGTR